MGRIVTQWIALQSCGNVSFRHISFRHIFGRAQLYCISKIPYPTLFSFLCSSPSIFLSPCSLTVRLGKKESKKKKNKMSPTAPQTDKQAQKDQSSKDVRWYHKEIGPQFNPLFRELLENYSHIPPEEVESHIHTIVSSTRPISSVVTKLRRTHVYTHIERQSMVLQAIPLHRHVHLPLPLHNRPSRIPSNPLIPHHTAAIAIAI